MWCNLVIILMIWPGHVNGKISVLSLGEEIKSVKWPFIAANFIDKRLNGLGKEGLSFWETGVGAFNIRSSHDLEPVGFPDSGLDDRQIWLGISTQVIQ